MKAITNFGKINGRRIMTFRVSNDGKIMRAGKWITAHEVFRRWKVARKAWQSRRNKQLALEI